MSMLENRKSGKKKGIGSGVKTAIAVAGAFVAIVLVLLATILANRRPHHKNTAAAAEISTEEAVVNTEKGESVGWESLADTETRTSDQLNFWHMYDNEEEDPTTVVPAGESDFTDDLVSGNFVNDEEESVSDNEVGVETVSSSQIAARESISGNFFDQNELSEGTADIVPIVSVIKKSTLFDDGFRMNGQFKEYALNDRKTSFTGIDVSKYQGDIDWKQVAASGIDFAMLRMGSRGYSRGQVIVDDKFAENLRGCSENGIRVGVYFYSQAVTPEEAIEEANYCIAAVMGSKVDYPIVFDSEEVIGDSYRTENLSPAQMSSIAQAFCNMVSMYGYTPMIGATKKQFASHFDMSTIEQYDWWLFDTDETSVFPYKYNIWQYSRTGKVDGINGAVNLDISFVDYSGR